MSSVPERIRSRFLDLFKVEPMLVRSPGRINLIGEHTDYNEGFVMPAAINKEVVFAIAPSADDQCLIFSEQYQELHLVNLLTPKPVHEPRWVNYLLGVIHQFVHRGLSVKPFQCVFGGDIPLGAGLSSSAAVECGFAFAINELFQFNLPRAELIRIAQWSEHNFVGVKCGIMDQFASVMGKAQHAVVLDCRTLEYQYVPVQLGENTIVLCDTKVKHALVDSQYNQRRRECEEGVQLLSRYYEHVKSLRDVSVEMLEQHKQEFPGHVYQRCRYVVDENKRVLDASRDLQREDLIAFGQKMFATHEGLSREYQVSCEELDFLVEVAREHPGVIGARMMGGGFGGCTINLVRRSAANDFIQTASHAYMSKFSREMETYRVSIEDGTSIFGKNIRVCD